ncbi:MAG: hypothetical protein ACRDIE_04205, partial [Chloroflexota bacterium]
DLAQASIGPGMAVYSRYARVLEANGDPVPVRPALQMINEALDEVVGEQDSEYDADTRWALAWYEQLGLKTGKYGEAETLSKAKNTSVRGLLEAGILEAKGGNVRLLGRADLAADWDPAADARFTVWEATQHLAHALETTATDGAAALLVRIGERADAARDLAYRLYLLCERHKWAEEGLAYNALVVAWPEIVMRARAARAADGPRQGELSLRMNSHGRDGAHECAYGTGVAGRRMSENDRNGLSDYNSPMFIIRRPLTCRHHANLFALVRAMRIYSQARYRRPDGPIPPTNF